MPNREIKFEQMESGYYETPDKRFSAIYLPSSQLFSCMDRTKDKVFPAASLQAAEHLILIEIEKEMR